jgi:hypothetical protein
LEWFVDPVLSMIYPGDYYMRVTATVVAIALFPFWGNLSCFKARALVSPTNLVIWRSVTLLDG